jgi:hypothetical protein
LVLAGILAFVALGGVLLAVSFAGGPDPGPTEAAPPRSPHVEAAPVANPLAAAPVESARPPEKPAAPQAKPSAVKPSPAANNPPARQLPAVAKKPVPEKPIVPEKKSVPQPPLVAEKKPAAKVHDPLGGALRLGPNLVTAQPPKPLSETVRKGLGWLVAHQNKDGSWGPGGLGVFAGRFGPGAFAPGRPGAKPAADVSTVPDTCIAALALVRSGSSPAEGEHRRRLARAVAYVCSKVEKADRTSLVLVRPVAGRFNPAMGMAAGGTTQVQTEIGTYADTFLATLLLSEVRGRMPDPRAERRVTAALIKLIAKLQRNHAPDGSWSRQGLGWAPVLGQALAAKGINRARQAGAKVADATLERARRFAAKSFDPRTGQFTLDLAAGVSLYSSAANLAALQDSLNTLKALVSSDRPCPGAARGRDQATKLRRIASYQETRKTQQQASRVVVGNLSDERFVKGFGSNGGEEFLSYLNISEALAAEGGAEWQKWDKAMAENLACVQNADGSYAGNHCITGQTFCTASALLVLMADRSPVPPAVRQGL